MVTLRVLSIRPDALATGRRGLSSGLSFLSFLSSSGIGVGVGFGLLLGCFGDFVCNDFGESGKAMCSSIWVKGGNDFEIWRWDGKDGMVIVDAVKIDEIRGWLGVSDDSRFDGCRLTLLLSIFDTVGRAFEWDAVMLSIDYAIDIL